jgi:TPR repeat protein
MFRLTAICFGVCFLTHSVLALSTDDAVSARVRGEFEAALKILRPLAAKGDPVAQFSLAEMYGKGQGVSQSYPQALAWYLKAAEQGHVVAQNRVGNILSRGITGVPVDYVRAVHWYRRAAEKGDAIAQHSLGMMYSVGEGVPQSYVEAVKWYRMAAEQGLDAAQMDLAMSYGRGEGVTQDYAEAARWLRKCAETGRLECQYKLGLLLADGAGAPRDYVEAHRWLNIAISRMGADDFGRDAAIKGRNAVAARMTPNQIAEAQKLARDWRSSKE